MPVPERMAAVLPTGIGGLDLMLDDYHLPEAPLVSNPFAVREGTVSVPSDCAPGLGAEVDVSVLGDPVFELPA